MFSTIISGSEITALTFFVCIAVAALLGAGTSLVFSYKSRQSQSFSLSLALLPMIVTLVIMMVNGNIGTGVAVAGAFTLVRFRSMPGTAREIAAIFTDMALGLALGMGYVGIAIVFFIIVGVITIALTVVGFGEQAANQMQLKITIPENFNYEGLFDDLFEKYTKSCKLIRIKTASMGTLFELTYEVTLPTENVPKEFLDNIRTRNGNLNVVIGPVKFGDTL